MSNYTYDLIIIGSGPGGYEAALHAGEKGLSVAIIDKRELAGGTCLHVGCIPSKTLLEATKLYHQSQQASKRGIQTKTTLSWEILQEYKDKVIQINAKGIESGFKKYDIQTYQGTASFVDSHTINIVSSEKQETISANYIIIATGSKPTQLPFVTVDHKQVLTSESILSLPVIPEKLVIVGAGVIALEMASVFRRLGSQVDIIEKNKSILQGADSDLIKEATKIVRKQKITLHVNTILESLQVQENLITLQLKDTQGQSKTLKATHCLLAIGRVPETENLSLEKIGIATNDSGYIITTKSKQTNLDHIYAIGDVTLGAMLAHKASNEAFAVVDSLCGKPSLPTKKEHIPFVVYTEPEIAWVGNTQEELKEQGIACKKGTCLFRSLGRSHASDALDGSLTLIADASNTIRGMHIVGERAADLVAIGMLAIAKETKLHEITSLAFAHPTFSEAIREAARITELATLS